MATTPPLLMAGFLLIMSAGSIYLLDLSSSRNGLSATAPQDTAAEPEHIRQTLPALIAEDTPYLTAEFPIKNVSNTAAQLVSVQKSCGCSDAELVKTYLLPGEETTLRVGVRMIHQFGPQRITCVVDDHAGRKRFYTLETTVYRRARFAEPVIHFGMVKPGDRLTRELTYVRAAASEAELADDVSFRTECSHITLGTVTAASEYVKDGVWVKTYHLPVALKAPNASEVGSAAVTAVRPTAPVDRSVTASVDWLVHSLYVLTPRQVFFTAAEVKAGAKVTKTVTVSRLDGKPVVLSSVESTHPQISARGRSGKASAIEIDVTLDPLRTGDLTVGDVVLHTDDPDQPVIQSARRGLGEVILYSHVSEEMGCPHRLHEDH